LFFRCGGDRCSSRCSKRVERLGRAELPFDEIPLVRAGEVTQEQLRLAERISQELLSVRVVEEIVAVGDPDGGTKPRTARKVRAGSRVSPALTDLAARLSDRLETRVRVDLGKERGKIVIEFANMKDLQRIVAALMPGDGDGDLDDAA